MKRKITALLLCLLLAVQLSGLPAGAAGNVYFLGAEENILPLSDATMPFWYNGYLYIASSIFTGTARDSLKVSHVTQDSGRTEILYRGGRSLWFQDGVSYAWDTEKNTYYPGGVYRNGILFVPASVVASFFELDYSIMEVQHGSLVWLRQPDFGLEEEMFADAVMASGVMARRYNEYQRSKADSQAQEIITPPETTTPIGEGDRLYLCLEAGGNAGELMDALERYDAGAAFFCSLEFLAENHGLLRRMTATGQSVGILVDGASDRGTVEEQLTRGNRILAQATGQMTRLARIENGTPEMAEAAAAAGFRLTVSGLEKAPYDLSTAVGARGLFRTVSAKQGDQLVWLGGETEAVSLIAFLNLTEQVEDQCLALTETVGL